MNIGKRIARFRVERKEIERILSVEGTRIIKRILGVMSLRAISRSTGLSPTYLSLVVNGKTTISMDAYLRLWRFENEENLM